MAVTPTIQNVQPTVGANADTWGGTVNSRLQETYADITALATQGNASETAVANSVLKTGSTSTGDQVLANVAPTSIFSAGYRGLPTISDSADRTILTSDAGKMLRFFGPANRALTIPTNATAAIPIGTVVPVRGYTGFGFSIIITPASGVSLTIAGSLTPVASATVASGGFASLIKEDTNIWFITGTGVS